LTLGSEHGPDGKPSPQIPTELVTTLLTLAATLWKLWQEVKHQNQR
jgi:hypothetical protein